MVYAEVYLGSVFKIHLGAITNGSPQKGPA